MSRSVVNVCMCVCLCVCVSHLLRIVIQKVLHDHSFVRSRYSVEVPVEVPDEIVINLFILIKTYFTYLRRVWWMSPTTSSISVM